MSEESYIEPQVLDQAKRLAADIAASDTESGAYRLAIDLMGCLADGLPDAVPGRLYVIWGDLTDAWELQPEKRPEAAAEIRKAASDLAAAQTKEAFAAYLSEWCQRRGVK